MPEVPDHLVPTDGLTNATLQLEGLDLTEPTGSCSLRFVINDEDGDHVGTFHMHVRPTAKNSTDAMLAQGYRQMCDVLRQWLYICDALRQEYEKR